jgi:hypothetical protein
MGCWRAGWVATYRRPWPYRYTQETGNVPLHTTPAHTRACMASVQQFKARAARYFSFSTCRSYCKLQRARGKRGTSERKCRISLRIIPKPHLAALYRIVCTHLLQHAHAVHTINRPCTVFSTILVHTCVRTAARPVGGVRTSLCLSGNMCRHHLGPKSCATAPTFANGGEAIVVKSSSGVYHAFMSEQLAAMGFT